MRTLYNPRAELQREVALSNRPTIRRQELTPPLAPSPYHQHGRAVSVNAKHKPNFSSIMAGESDLEVASFEMEVESEPETLRPTEFAVAVQVYMDYWGDRAVIDSGNSDIVDILHDIYPVQCERSLR